MEFLNKIKIRGIVGKASVARVGEKSVCRFSIVVDYCCKMNGMPVIENTWFNVVAHEGDFSKITKGAVAEVAGRLRKFSVTLADGTTHNSDEIVAKSVKVLDS